MLTHGRALFFMQVVGWMGFVALLSGFAVLAVASCFLTFAKELAFAVKPAGDSGPQE